MIVVGARTAAGLAVSLCLLVAAAGTAHAQTKLFGQPEPPPITDPAIQGNLLLEKGDYQGALERFRLAFQTTRDSTLRVGIAKALKGLGRNLEAVHELEAFLSTKALEGGSHYGAERLLRDLRLTLAVISFSCEEVGAKISLDGQPVAVSPVTKSITVMPGLHQITAEREGFQPYKEEVVPGEGVTLTLEIRLQPVYVPPPVVVGGPPGVSAVGPLGPAPAATPAPLLGASAKPGAAHKPPGITEKWWFWAGVAAVVAVGAGGFLLVSHSEKDAKCGSLGSCAYRIP